ncbi:nucleotidyltransferase domain-containing protein [Comamonas sp. AG1104]|uniref:nucleotidyltransferase domain-containing protein n=1 Tax=Comamonas sp. AG1104 TaxID=2183900 RepID=UPI000E2DD628|nr:nucleotidyltransferase domain-containing protein [Comamonas sp. AG1104]RDI10901.1 putative nucleotidyltransferase [Comamonas sp. AG1104]
MQTIEHKAIPGAYLLLEVMRAMHCKQKHDMTALLAGESGKQGWGFTSPNSNQDLLI